MRAVVSESDFNGFFPLLRHFDFSQDRQGWTLGGGVETQLIGNWTAKAEYIYIDFGEIRGGYANPLPPSAFATTRAFSTTVRDHVFRLGLNYKFDWPWFASY